MWRTDILKIFITGSEGFIGSNLKEYFSEHHEIREYDIKNGKDINNLEQLERAIKSFRPDWILHLAAQAFADKSFYSPIEDCTVNVLGTLNILLMSEIFKIPVIVFSSSAVYGYNNDVLTEDLPPEPISFYGVSKACSELYCRFFSTVFNSNIIVFRISSAYDSNRDVSVNKLCRTCIEKRKVTVTNDGEQSRDFINIKDIIQAIELAFDKKLAPGIYNLGCGKDYTINHTVSLIEKYIGKKIDKEYVPTSFLELHKNKISIDKIKKYGYSPTVLFEKGLKSLVEEYLKEKTK